MCVFHVCVGTDGDQMTELESLDLHLLAGVLGTEQSPLSLRGAKCLLPSHSPDPVVCIHKLSQWTEADLT